MEHFLKRSFPSLLFPTGGRRSQENSLWRRRPPTTTTEERRQTTKAFLRCCGYGLQVFTSFYDPSPAKWKSCGAINIFERASRHPPPSVLLLQQVCYVGWPSLWSSCAVRARRRLWLLRRTNYGLPESLLENKTKTRVACFMLMCG